MQVSELVELGRFLETFLREEDLAQRYKKLIGAVNQAAQNQNPQNVRARRDELIALHRKAEAWILSPAQASLLASFGGAEVLGDTAIQRIDEVFAKHQAHPQGLQGALQQLLNEADSLQTRSKQLIDALGPMLSDLPEPSLAPNHGRIWLRFSDAASVETVDELEKAAGTWKTILHHFSRLPDASPESGHILRIQKCSPLEIEISAALVTLGPLLVGVHFVLAKVEHVIKILQEAEKLKLLKVKKKVVELLLAEAEEHRSAIAAEAADEVKSKYGGTNEARTAVEKGLRQILGFIEDGGALDIDVGEDEPDEDQGDTVNGESDRPPLRALVEKVRKGIKLLPASTPGDVDEDDS